MRERHEHHTGSGEVHIPPGSGGMQHPESAAAGMAGQGEITVPGSGPTEVMQEAGSMAVAQTLESGTASAPASETAPEASHEPADTRRASIEINPPADNPLRRALAMAYKALPPDADVQSLLTARQQAVLPDLLGSLPSSEVAQQHGIVATGVSQYTRQILLRLMRNRETAPHIPEAIITAPDVDLSAQPGLKEAAAAVHQKINAGKAALAEQNGGVVPSWRYGQAKEVVRLLGATGFHIEEHLPETQVNTRNIVRLIASGASSARTAKELGITTSQVSNGLRQALDTLAYVVPRDELPESFPQHVLTPNGAIYQPESANSAASLQASSERQDTATLSPALHTAEPTAGMPSESALTLLPEQTEVQTPNSAPTGQLSPDTPLRDRMRATVGRLQGRVPLDTILNVSDREILPALMGDKTYGEVAESLGVAKSSVVYRTHIILGKAQRAADAIANGRSLQSPPPLSPLRIRMQAAIAIIRESGVDPASVIDDEYRALYDRVSSNEPSSRIQADLGMETSTFHHKQEAIMRRLMNSPETGGLVPPEVETTPQRSALSAEVVQAIKATRASELPWGSGQPRAILDTLVQNGFDIARHIPEDLARMRTVASMIAEGRSMRQIHMETKLPPSTVSRLAMQAVEVIRHTVANQDLPEGLPENLFKPNGR